MEKKPMEALLGLPSRPIEVITVLNLLGHRHGFVPLPLEQKIDRLTSEQVDQLSIVLFDFRQLSDLELWLAQFG